MLFTSLVFLFLFLPFVLLVHTFLKADWRNTFLFFVSLFFYAWGEPTFVFILLASITVNYFFGRAIGSFRSQGGAWLAVGVLLNLLLLFYFKYITFFLANLLPFWTKLGFAPFEIPEVWLPIGISFFTFQGLSYLVDVYRGQVAPQKSIVALGMYIALFPQLIAGPIVRYQNIEEEIASRKVSADAVAAGLRIFIIGLAQKLVLANPLGKIADTVFSAPEMLTMPLAWLGIAAYSLQIYYDFAGYSTMAIGLGRALGFTFPENFNFPYVAASVTEFWRRWHISLSTWFRDYVYIPLGGNRKGTGRTLRNLLVVFCATGFWHGANWTFLCWGLWHGLFLVIERLFRAGGGTPVIPGIIRHIYTLLVVMLGWVFFRSDTMGEAMNFISHLFNFREAGLSPLLVALCNPLNGFFFLLGALGCLPFLMERTAAALERRASLFDACSLCLLGISILFLVNSEFNPFLYFRF